VIPLAAGLALSLLQQAPEQKPFEEKVTVSRVVVNVHVVDDRGAPITGLKESDFRVAVDNRLVVLESAEWVGPPESGRGKSASRAAPAPSPVPGPSVEIALPVSEDSRRLLVFVFQWEIAGQKQEGFVRMQKQAREFVKTLEPDDRVAVLLFGSRLWLKQDFTADRGKLDAALERISRTAEDRTPDPAAGVSLASLLPEAQARAATSIEKALASLGRALEPTVGKKSLLLFGWGIGKWTPTFRNEIAGYVRQTPEYEPAREALTKAETSVFCLDVSDGRHTLSDGLERVAYETGGLYVPTWDFPRFAMEKVGRTLVGHYVLVFRKPPGPAGFHTIDVRLAGRVGNVLHRRFYDDSRPSP
jgi:VWFA-related protein